MKLKSFLEPFKAIKIHGFKKGLGMYLAGNIIRLNITRYFPKLADYIVSKRKGYCHMCGNCCPTCHYKINKKCSIYGRREKILGHAKCRYGPFPTDFWLNRKWKNCTYYYGKKKNK